jgi:hypothetical protein
VRLRPGDIVVFLDKWRLISGLFGMVAQSLSGQARFARYTASGR